MNDLQIHLNRLTAVIKERCGKPFWTHILMTEYSSVEHGEIINIPKVALLTPEQYAQRFDELLEIGYSWIHLDALGTAEGALIVIVMWPREAVGAPRDRVSVNLSWSCETANKIQISD